ncbi:MAG: hypothetical protein C4324_04170 [Blastocatellia bacterium]
MNRFDGRADAILEGFLSGGITAGVSIIDSCGARTRGQNKMFLAAGPVDIYSLRTQSPSETLGILNEVFDQGKTAVFTLSYDFGLRLQGIKSRHSPEINEPDLFVAVYDSAVLYDYDTGDTKILGSSARAAEISARINGISVFDSKTPLVSLRTAPKATASPPKDVYISQIETIKELIRAGKTYQTNLTRRVLVEFYDRPSPAEIFFRGRKNHPAGFAALIERGDSSVVSLSPERFFSIRGRRITASPIKGTRRRGDDRTGDRQTVAELSASVKDRAENIMIVDLLRNDLGRICKYGSIEAGPLLQIEELPSLFHLVSHISGTLRESIRLSDVLAALFPCGSVTGAPKISTLKIIDELEAAPRGLSMGAIGLILPSSERSSPDVDVSVAIRTLVVRDRKGIFNVGGGIVIDSDPQSEFDETQTKAAALISACGIGEEVLNASRTN